MLQQPMKEKLHALKLQGMIEALGMSGTGRSNAGVELSLTVWRSSSISSGTGVRTRPSPGESLLLACGALPASRTSIIGAERGLNREHNAWVGPRV